MSNRVRGDDLTAEVFCLFRVARAAQSAEGQAALEDLCALLWLPVRDYIVRKIRESESRDFAADVAQETLCIVAQRLPSCRASTIEEFWNWVTRIAERAALAMIRRDVGHLAVRYFHAEYAEAVDTEAASRWEEFQRELSADERLVFQILCGEFEALPVRTQQIIRGRLIEGATWEEVATALGTTASGARRVFQRAQAALRRRFVREAQALPDPPRDRILSRIHRWVARDEA